MTLSVTSLFSPAIPHHKNHFSHCLLQDVRGLWEPISNLSPLWGCGSWKWVTCNHNFIFFILQRDRLSIPWDSVWLTSVLWPRYFQGWTPHVATLAAQQNLNGWIIRGEVAEVIICFFLKRFPKHHGFQGNHQWPLIFHTDVTKALCACLDSSFCLGPPECRSTEPRT